MKILNFDLNYKHVASIVVFLYLVWPDRYAIHYPHIDRDEIMDHLIRQTSKNMTIESFGKDVCYYGDIIRHNRQMYTAENRISINNPDEILQGGEYYPRDCAPLFSTAIIVSYRNREEQLNKFLIYMHNYLRKQNIHYRVFLIEQFDQNPFNRAKLFNIGAVTAMKYDFPCLILTDVDLFPLNLGQIYACTKRPRHMCASLDSFRYNLPYYSLFGGVSAIDTETFWQINGMSNLYSGWGGEDDDFFVRLRLCNFEICRFEPAYSQYTMLKHKKEKPNENRVALLMSGANRYKQDGLNSLIFIQRDFKLEALYTHVLVEV